MKKPAYVQLIVSLVLLAITEFVYRGFWIEGFNQPFVDGHNFGKWFDLLITGGESKTNWASINALPTAAHTIWGVLAGQLLMSHKTDNKKLYTLLLAASISLLIGYSLNPITPIIKRIATTSFIFASGEWTMLALAVSYWLIDIKKFERGVKFFAIIGMNPLFIYQFAHVGGANMVSKIFRPLSYTLFNWTSDLGVDIINSIVVSFV